MTTHQIVVPTPFNDITELAENFASRVDEERLMLPHSEPITEGEWVQFVVTLGDESTALMGMGRCSGAFDNGEDRAAEHRYDIVLEAIELDGMGQVYFDRILQVRAAQMGDEPVTGQVAVPREEDAYVVDAVVPEVGLDPLPEAPYDAAPYDAAPYDAAPYEEPPPVASAADAFVDDSTMAFAAEEVAAAWQPPPEPEPEPAFAPSQDLASLDNALLEDEPASGHAPLAFEAPERSAIYEVTAPVAPGPLPTPFAEAAVLTRRALMSSWSPEPLPRPDPGDASGYFQYAMGAGLPQPVQPPRPAIDPSLRVMRAPRAGDPHHVPSFAPRAAVAVHAHEAAAYAAADYAEADASVAAEGEYAEGEYAEDAGYDQDYAEGYEAPAEGATREVDVGDLPEEESFGGDETMQVGIDEDEY